MASFGLGDGVKFVSCTRNIFDKCYDHVDGDIVMTQQMLKQLRSKVCVCIDMEFTKKKINNCGVHQCNTENNISIVENNLKQLFGANCPENDNFSLIDSDGQLKDHEVFAVLNDESNDINSDVNIEQSKYDIRDKQSQIKHFKTSGFSQIIFKKTSSNNYNTSSNSITTTQRADSLPNTNEIIDLTLSEGHIKMKRKRKENKRKIITFIDLTI